MDFPAELDRLEDSGQWLQALELLTSHLGSGANLDADTAHRLGRLHQRIGGLDKAERAYLLSLSIDPARPLTFNNLALLALQRLQPDKADQWLNRGLALAETSQDKDLLHATGCSLRLFELRHVDALAFADNQLSIRETVMARTNRASCLHRLGRLKEAVRDQERAIRLHLNEFATQLQDAPLTALVGVACKQLQQTCILQTMLMTQGIFKLCLQSGDADGLQLLLAGQMADPMYWLDPARRISSWDGSKTNDLLVWDDQGFGDTLQNLSWLHHIAPRVERLRLWLRPALIPLVKQRFTLPCNCSIEPMAPERSPWSQGMSQVGSYYLPIVMRAWTKRARANGKPYLCSYRSNHNRLSPRIGLVWSAGRHKAPQPERSARVRDVPRQPFFELAQRWRLEHRATLFSLQLEGNDEKPVQDLIQAGLLEQPLSSPNWQETAEVLDSLDLLVSVDTSVAHLAGALGIPTVLLLSAPADWRWGQADCQTFLYDSVRLVRCAAPGDWTQALLQADLQVSDLLSLTRCNRLN